MKSQHAGLCVEETKECELALPHSSEVGRTLTLLLPKLFGWPRGGHTGLRRFRTKRRGNSNWVSISRRVTQRLLLPISKEKRRDTRMRLFLQGKRARAHREYGERFKVTITDNSSQPSSKKKRLGLCAGCESEIVGHEKKRRKKPAEIRTISRFPISS